MHIDSYQFGKIVIDGVAYSGDCLILGDSVQPNWWRKQGHLLSAEDVQPVIVAKPSVLVVGCGASGLMKVPQDTRLALQESNIQLEALDTHKAVQRFNELSQAGANVAAALHLTC
ncbi:MAG: Mth938-like domain-containing protein [Planctomycetota bacterium]